MGDLWRSSWGLVLVAVVAAAILAGCGDDTAKELSQQQKIEEARKDGARDEKIKQLEKDSRQQAKSEGKPSGPSGSGGSSGSTAPATSGATACGDGVSAGPNTSCPFARAVRDNYPASSDNFAVYSSVTGQTYTMSCTTSSPHVCRGGNDAFVYFP